MTLQHEERRDEERARHNGTLTMGTYALNAQHSIANNSNFVPAFRLFLFQNEIKKNKCDAMYCVYNERRHLLLEQEKSIMCINRQKTV